MLKTIRSHIIIPVSYTHLDVYKRQELKEARLRYANVKNENHALNSEMESTGRILEEILEQFEQKEAENDILRREVDEFQTQLLAVKRDKLAQEQANLCLLYTSKTGFVYDRRETLQ